MEPLGERALLVTPPHGWTVVAAASCLQAERRPGIEDIVPAYEKICVHYEPHLWAGKLPESAVARWVQDALAHAGREALPEPRSHEVPVRYGGAAGPDLEDVALRLGLQSSDVVALHSGASYTVAAIGFLQGFPYLRGLPEELKLPRRSEPRHAVAAGSVAIAAGQAGIYPQVSPGGWHVLGRTDWVLFDAKAEPAVRLAVGDMVRFFPVKEDGA